MGCGTHTVRSRIRQARTQDVVQERLGHASIAATLDSATILAESPSLKERIETAIEKLLDA